MAFDRGVEHKKQDFFGTSEDVGEMLKVRLTSFLQVSDTTNLLFSV
jgi:hypothetical protein